MRAQSAAPEHPVCEALYAMLSENKALAAAYLRFRWRAGGERGRQLRSLFDAEEGVLTDAIQDIETMAESKCQDPQSHDGSDGVDIESLTLVASNGFAMIALLAEGHRLARFCAEAGAEVAQAEALEPETAWFKAQAAAHQASEARLLAAA
ncbi:MAG: hypothetical protein AAFQ67_08860 [Pseudomonadota bacterium]